MQIRKAVLFTVAGALLLPLTIKAQKSSINTFSPYTLYGVGGLSTQGTANLRSMGGIGVGYRDSRWIDPFMVTFNYLNPASYSAVPQMSFVFNFELEGENFYLSDGQRKTSYNTFNVRDIGFVLPIARNFGMGFSLTPYSSIGYKMETRIDDDEIVANIGDVWKKYSGSGDINQFKLGLGYQLFKNFSVGVDAIYYHGYLDRVQNITIESITGGGGYGDTQAHMSEKVSRFMMMAGMQYSAINKPERSLTFGATYNLGGKLNSTYKQYVPSDYYGSDTTFLAFRTSDVSLPNKIAVGVYYQTYKVGLGVDYSFSDWGSRNRGYSSAISGGGYARYKNTNTVSAGVELTPNRFEARKYMKRVSYRAGVRYEQDYMTYNGNTVDTKAVTFGVGVPIRLGMPSKLNLGLEYGQKGKTGGNMVKANYFKFSIGLMLFGEDYWFYKQKYD
ncbi:MAG: hypothetical protein LUF87_06650 [Alistipes sp.]|nr:hypothetical protein [Alistipes sp.]